MDSKNIDLPDSCGIITISRCQGRVDLYGSPFTHENFIELRISGASESTGISGTNRYADRQKSKIRVWLSASQFAQAITTLNSGATPCTIRTFGETELPEFKLDILTEDRIKFNNDGLDQLNTAIAAIDEAIAAARLLKTRKEREAVLKPLEDSRRSLADRLPFVAEMFNEYMEKVQQQAKTEVAAYCDMAISNLGLQALATQDRIVELPAGEPFDQLSLPFSE